MTEHTIKCNKFNKIFNIVYNLCCCERRNYYQHLLVPKVRLELTVFRFGQRSKIRTHIKGFS